MRGWKRALRLVPTTLSSASVCWWRAWRLRRWSAIYLTRRSYYEPPANWDCWFLGEIWWRDWPPLLCWPWTKTLALRVFWETLSQVMLAPWEVVRPSRVVEPFTLLKSVWASLWEVSEETWEWVLLETLGLMEPNERSCSHFSWSNLKTNDSTVDPRSLRSACVMTFSSVEKTFPNRVAIFCFLRKNWKRVKSLFDCKEITADQ